VAHDVFGADDPLSSLYTGESHAHLHPLASEFRGWDGIPSVGFDAVGTPVGILQKMIRHADVTITMDVMERERWIPSWNPTPNQLEYARVGFSGVAGDRQRSQLVGSDGRGGGIRSEWKPWRLAVRAPPDFAGVPIRSVVTETTYLPWAEIR
jgi:hypothetical protein